MCGIAGIYHLDGRGADPRTLAAMCGLLHHRGPDGQGFALFDDAGRCQCLTADLHQDAPVGPLGLAHRRLAILDLSPTGAQPMSYAAGRFWITYNGEIYNYRELRDELLADGYAFASTSDTEVILAAWQKWGINCVRHFNGMWAFALWDSREKILFCSRDHVGMKPFYYAWEGRGFFFASEIKALLAAWPQRSPRINEPALARFIVSGRMDDGPETLFTDVRQLLPGHNLLLARNVCRQWRYWDTADSHIPRETHLRRTEVQLVEQFRELLFDAVRLRLRADVPVGVCLSGGLDSSAISACAALNLPRIKSFTVAYDEPDYAEGHFARAVAEKYQTDSYDISPTPADYVPFLERFNWFHDEPSPGPGLFSQWYVMQLASGHVKVLLDGQGADELLAGYPHYYNYYLADRFRHLWAGGSQRITLPGYVQECRAAADSLGTSAAAVGAAAARRLFGGVLPEETSLLAQWLRRIWPRRANAGAFNYLLQPRFLHDAAPAVRPQSRRFAGELNNLLCEDLQRDNIPMLMHYGDRTSMAFSIESRVPFLDYRLIDFCADLPVHFKIRGRTSKYILRRAMGDLLPPAVIGRTDKKGYPNPFGLWLRGPLYDVARDIIASASFARHEVFRPAQALLLLEQHRARQADHTWLLWRIINVEQWLRIFQDDFSRRVREKK